jgi:hypothetical protein
MLLTLCSLHKLKKLYRVLRLLRVSLIISLLMNQTKILTSLELWHLGTLEIFNLATLETCTVESWSLPKPWNLA